MIGNIVFNIFVNLFCTIEFKFGAYEFIHVYNTIQIYCFWIQLVDLKFELKSLFQIFLLQYDNENSMKDLFLTESQIFLFNTYKK